MTNTVPPEAAEFFTLMLEETRLPDDRDTSGFWLGHAQQLRNSWQTIVVAFRYQTRRCCSDWVACWSK